MVFIGPLYKNLFLLKYFKNLYLSKGQSCIQVCHAISIDWFIQVHSLGPSFLFRLIHFDQLPLKYTHPLLHHAEVKDPVPISRLIHYSAGIQGIFFSCHYCLLSWHCSTTKNWFAGAYIHPFCRQRQTTERHCPWFHCQNWRHPTWQCFFFLFWCHAPYGSLPAPGCWIQVCHEATSYPKPSIACFWWRAIRRVFCSSCLNLQTLSHLLCMRHLLLCWRILKRNLKSFLFVMP